MNNQNFPKITKSSNCIIAKERQTPSKLIKKSTFNWSTVKRNFTKFYTSKSQTFNFQEPTQIVTTKSKYDIGYLYNAARDAKYATIYDKSMSIIKIIDIIIGMFSLVSIIWVFADNEVFSQKAQKFLNNYMELNNISKINYNIFKEIENRNISAKENGWRIANTIISFVTIVFLIYQYKLLRQLYKLNFIFTKINMYWLITRCIIAWICNPMSSDVLIYEESNKLFTIYTLNSWIAFCSLLKISLCKQLFWVLTKFNSEWTKSILRNYSIKPNVVHYFRFYMFSHPVAFLLITSSITAFSFAFILRFCEFLSIDKFRGYLGNKGINDLRSFFTCVWLVYSTLFPLGFGDVYPRSNMGRVLVMILSACSIIIMGYFILHISWYIQLTKEQHNAYSKLKTLNNMDAYESKATNVIASLLILRKKWINRKKIKINNSTRYFKELYMMLILYNQQKKNWLNEDYISEKFSMPLNRILDEMQRKMIENINAITSNFEATKSINEDLEELTESQDDMMQRISTIITQQVNIKNFWFRNFNRWTMKRVKKNRKFKYSSVLQKNKIDISHHKMNSLLSGNMGINGNNQSISIKGKRSLLVNELKPANQFNWNKI